MANTPRLYYPVRPFVVNQHFGDNIPCVQHFGLPTQKVVDGTDNHTCPVGYDKLYQHFGMTGHNGVDLEAGEQNVYAAAAGTVIEIQSVPSRGLGMGILSETPYDLGASGIHYIKLRYWHLKSFVITVGSKLREGDLIGVTDNTGYSSADHLHFELCPMDLDQGGHPFYANPIGSIASAINPEPFFIGEYADDVPQNISLTQQLILMLQRIVVLLQSKT